MSSVCVCLGLDRAKWRPEKVHSARQRKARDRRCLIIELRETGIDAMNNRGLLKSETRNDPSAVIMALYAVLDST
jgi:hypothetical protein